MDKIRIWLSYTTHYMVIDVGKPMYGTRYRPKEGYAIVYSKSNEEILLNTKGTIPKRFP